MTAFTDAMKDEGRKTLTENGAVAYNTTTNNLTDLFAVIGGMRGQDESRLHALIDGAYAEDKSLLAKMLFQTRDIRGGLGERGTFRKAMRHCAVKHQDIMEKNIQFIPEYGRWDDMFCLIGTPFEERMFAIVRERLDKDTAIVNGDAAGTVSLLAKWLPTGDATSVNTRRLAKIVAKGLGFKDVREYKRAYRPLRAHLDTVERKMTAKRWTDIEYPKVPSRCMFKHTGAFARNDGERYEKYLGDVCSGKETIHADTLYPYDIVGKVAWYGNEVDTSLDVLWNALPDYVDGGRNYLVMADVSGSMQGTPMDTSVGLAIYFAQRNKGAYHNMFMTFSENPQICNIRGGVGICDTVRAVRKADWGMNTDLGKAMEKILEIAVKSNSKQEDLPEALVIVTDMEFDIAYRSDMSFLDAMRQRFSDNGYSMPNIVFWNVCSRHDTYHETSDRKGVVMVSGHSVSTFGRLMAGLNGKSAYDFMVETLSDERYSRITV